MNNKSLNKVAVKAGAWYTISNIALKGCAFLTLPIFTYMMSTSDFGTYNTYIAYEGIITAIIGLGFYGTVKNAKLDYKEKFDEYMSSILCISLMFLAICLSLINILYIYIPDFLGFNRFIGNCLILQSYGSFLLYLYGSKLNIEFKYKSYVLLSMLNTVINIVASILLIIFVFPNDRAYGRILGSAFPLIVIGIVLTLVIIIRGRKGYNKNYWQYALKIGLPLVPHTIAQSILLQFDRIMIRDICGESYSGIYSYIYTLCTITYVIAMSLDNAWTPWIYMKINNKNNNEIKDSSNKYIGLFTVLTIGFICVMPEICKLFAKSEYWSGIDLLIPLSISNFFIFLYFLPVGLEYYNKKTLFISIGTLSAAALNFALNYIFIKKFGYRAAAYTTLFSYFVLFIFHWLIARKYNMSKLYDMKYIIKSILIIALSSAIIMFTNNNYIVSISIRYLFVIIIMFALFKNRDLLFKFLKGDKNGEEKN